MNLVYVLASFVLTVGIQNASAATSYTMDPSHSSVGFSIDHLMITKVHGRFDKFEGTFALDEKSGAVTDIAAKIDIDSINTNEKKRDDHLRNNDFFGVRVDNKINESKRWMTFKAAQGKLKSNKPGKIKGELSMNGVTKPVTLNVTYRGPIKDPWGNQKVGFEASTKINRKDFALTWNKALEAGGIMVGETVDITIVGEAAAATTKKME